LAELFGGLTFARFGGWLNLALTVASLLAITTVAVTTIVLTVTNVLHFTVAINGTPWPIAVTAVVVTLAAIVLARGSAALATWGSAAAAWRAHTTVGTLAAVGTVSSVTATLRALTTGAVTSGIETPRRRWRCTCPLDLQQVVAADALVVHLVVRIIGIASRLVFHKGEEPRRSRTGSRNVATDKATITWILLERASGAAL
jgi:hypothetical protein